jgi:hypothetical protein
MGVRVEEALTFPNIATYFYCNIPVSKKIDDIRHLWILETKEYEKRCAILQGRTFIHHSSSDYLECQGYDIIAHNNELEREVAMLVTYVINYGPFEVERTQYWLFAAHLIKNNGWSVEQLNEWLTSAIASPA